MAETKYFVCSDEHKIAYRIWLPKQENKPSAFLQILHGVAEHGERYERFAKVLNKKGIAVFSSDHRGHGKTASENEKGWFAEKDGWFRIADDAFELANYISNEYSAPRMFLLGHSMGSFLSRTIMVQHPNFYSGVVLMGTGASQGILGSIGKMIAKHEIKKNGSRTPSELLNKLSFAPFNKKFEPIKTSFDWLSSDPIEVEKYISDSDCGFVCSCGLYFDLLTGIDFANDKKKASTLPNDLPILIISGDQDPVGGFSKGVKKVFSLYQEAGIADLSLKLIPNARHEILNETTRKETSEFILDWITSRI